MLSIGEKITAIRNKLKIKQKDFAEAIGIMPQALVRNEKNAVKPSADLLIKISETYKVNLNWLLTDNGEMFLDQEQRAKEPKNEGIDEIIKALQKLTPDRQKYYYHKIMAESLERSEEEEETKSPQAREEHDALFA